ncbi:MAG: hypothetical protein Tp1125DCM00d2C21254131_53 [Prokaryotic dsDNA virus sp.]|nr:MAG: hypothetical protein Tp1125DCM00d2C21254131_53 [Prokaryotic dsDNA virus sp.]|tara:strand:- start:1502 stop:1867 length:366 start_codon:yes stop_codon:yes gene_type:complete
MLEFSEILSGFLGAGVTGLLGYFTVVRKTKADETGLALNAWKELIEPLITQLNSTKEELESIRAEGREREEIHKRESEKLLQEVEALRLELAERDEKHRIEVDKLVEQIRRLRLEVEKYKK